MYYNVVGIIVLLLDIWALIAILQSGGAPLEKLIWVLVIILMPLLGFILWYIFGPGSKTFPLSR